MSEATEGNKGNKKNILVIIIVLLVLINLALLIFGLKNESQNKEVIAQKDTEIVDLRTEFDSLTKEMDLRISEIARLGGDTTTLGEMNRQLKADAEKYKKDATYARSQSKKMSEQIGAMKLMIDQKDSEIASLRAANDALNTENLALKEEKVKLGETIQDLTTTKQELTVKVELASQLRAEKFLMSTLDKRDREKPVKKQDNPELKRATEKVKVSFTIADNKVAAIGNREIFLRILEPEGSVIYDLSAGSGTFTVDGNELYYTAKKDILFDNRTPLVDFIYRKGSDYKRGKHTVEVYCEGAKIGSHFFTVK